MDGAVERWGESHGTEVKKTRQKKMDAPVNPSTRKGG